MRVIIGSPETGEEFEKYYEIRWRILRKSWGKPRGSEKDDNEEKAIHIMALIDDEIVGIGRVHFNSDIEAQIRYMAVEKEHRGKTIGSLVLKELEKRAKIGGAKYIILNARENAIKFYRKHDYEIEREAHTLFESIRHWKMRKVFDDISNATSS